jgi:hypothetical protein
MLRNADKRLLARGLARSGPAGRDPADLTTEPVEDSRLAARALVDLADRLLSAPDA